MLDKTSHKLIDTSVRRYLDFIDSLPIAVYRITIEGKIVYCNKEFAKLFGFSSIDEIIGQPIINLYKNKKDRGSMIQSIINSGRVVDYPISFIKKDGSLFWCAATERAVLDDDCMVILIDGAIRDITSDVKGKKIIVSQDDIEDNNSVAILILDIQGNFLEINKAGVALFGLHSKNEMAGKPLSDFLTTDSKEILSLFLDDIVKIERAEIILSIIDTRGIERHIELNCFLERHEMKPDNIKIIAHDVTDNIEQKRKQSVERKFQGVLEMAGGVVHRLNQPLTVVNNLLDEVLSDLEPNSKNYKKIIKVYEQINKLNEITKKISSIKKYEAVEYVAGIKIVDIDKAS
ncbi:MAG: PAS domain-containing protein [Deltaproteobacteria bacterium]|nr:PAS domain-containing protein [Deltaproteobacteria bacterium]